MRYSHIVLRGLLVAISLSVLKFSIELFVWLTDVLGLADCLSNLLTLSCELPRPGLFGWPAHLAVFVLSLGIVALFTTRLRRYSSALFFLLSAGTLGFCCVFDFVLQLPVRNFSRLFTQTFNLLSFVIFLSFLFAIVIVTPNMRLVYRTVGAMLQSYIARDLAFVLYLAVQPWYPGMTALYLMFTVYSFGAFTIHIMSVAGIIGASGLRRDR